MAALSIFWRNVKWRFQNPATILMTLIQPLIWLLLFSTLFGGATPVGGENYTAFVLPGILVMTVLFSAGISGISNYALKSAGSFYRIYVSPVKRRSIVLGHILDVEVLALIEIFILMVLSWLLAVQIQSGMVGFLLMIIQLAAAVFFVASLSYALSFAFQDENPFIALVNTLVLPLFFLSPALIPLESVPAAFRVPVAANPFTYLINSLRGLVLNSAVDWTQVMAATGLMLLLSVLSFCLAVRQLEKRG